MILAGLDTGTKSGIAILDGDRLIHAEAKSFGVGRPDYEVFHNFRVWLIGVLRAHKVDEVAIEQPLRSDLTRSEFEMVGGESGPRAVRVSRPIGTMRTFLRLYGLRAHAIQICGQLASHREVNVQEWRDVIHGRRVAPKGTKDATKWWKAQARARCEQLRWRVPSDDAAEAALIAEYLRIKLKEERLGISARPGDLFERASA